MKLNNTNRNFLNQFVLSSKLIELAEELKVVGNNMRSLEVSETEAKSREEGQAEAIRDMAARLKDVISLSLIFIIYSVIIFILL